MEQGLIIEKGNKFSFNQDVEIYRRQAIASEEKHSRLAGAAHQQYSVAVQPFESEKNAQLDRLIRDFKTNADKIIKDFEDSYTQALFSNQLQTS